MYAAAYLSILPLPCYIYHIISSPYSLKIDMICNMTCQTSSIFVVPIHRPVRTLLMPCLYPPYPWVYLAFIYSCPSLPKIFIPSLASTCVPSCSSGALLVPASLHLTSRSSILVTDTFLLGLQSSDRPWQWVLTPRP